MYKPIQYIEPQSLGCGLSYTELKPSASLARFISCYWIVETNMGKVESVSHRVLPDGCTDIIFDFITQSSFICGLADKTEVLTLNGKVKYLGIRFLPHAAAYILKNDTPNSLNRRFELKYISKPFKEMAAEVLAQNDPGECINVIEKYLVPFFTGYTINHRFNFLLNHALDRNGIITVKELSCYHSISEKQIGRYFLNNIGISTKPFLRILRFQNAYQKMALFKQSNSNYAVDAGFYDQSHLIKELKYFLGSKNYFC